MNSFCPFIQSAQYFINLKSLFSRTGELGAYHYIRSFIKILKKANVSVASGALLLHSVFKPIHLMQVRYIVHVQ